MSRLKFSWAMNENRYLGKRCGVRLDTPAIVYLYEDRVDKKLRNRVMPVRGTLGEGERGLAEAAEALRLRHGQQRLASIPPATLHKMLALIRGRQRGETIQEVLLRYESVGNEKAGLEGKEEGKDGSGGGVTEGDDTDLELDDMDIPLDKMDSGDDSFWENHCIPSVEPYKKELEVWEEGFRQTRLRRMQRLAEKDLEQISNERK